MPMTLAGLLADATAKRERLAAGIEAIQADIKRIRAASPLDGDALGRAQRSLSDAQAELRQHDRDVERLTADQLRDAAIARLQNSIAPAGSTRSDIIAGLKATLRTTLDELNQATDPDTRARLDAEIDVIESRLGELADDEQRDAAIAAMQNDTPESEVGVPAPGSNTERGNTVPKQNGPVFIRSHDRKPAAVERGRSWSDHEIVREYAEANAQRDALTKAQYGGIGQMVRALTTSSGSAIVPTEWSTSIIDRARNIARVLQAGAQLVPMDAKVVQIGRLTADPTAAFRTEGSTITPSDPSFDNVTLTAQTMSVLTVGSMEWFQDAENADSLVENAIAQAIALQLDLVALYGSITSGAGSINLPTPPNPRGVLGALLAQLPTNVLGAAANGTALTATSAYGELTDTVYQVKNGNEEPNAVIMSPRLGAKYARSYDTTGQPVAVPPALADLPRLESKQIPSYTQGTMTNVATDVFAGDFSQLLIGQRLDLSIQVLTERYAENGQVGIVAHWRGDVGVARPTAFAVYRALGGV